MMVKVRLKEVIYPLVICYSLLLKMGHLVR